MNTRDAILIAASIIAAGSLWYLVDVVLHSYQDEEGNWQQVERSFDEEK